MLNDIASEFATVHVHAFDSLHGWARLVTLLWTRPQTFAASRGLPTRQEVLRDLPGRVRDRQRGRAAAGCLSFESPGDAPARARDDERDRAVGRVASRAS
jgi:hypothetical protein